MLSRYFRGMFCWAEMNFKGTNSAEFFFARYIISFSAYRPFVEIIISITFLWHLSGTNVRKFIRKILYVPDRFHYTPTHPLCQ